MTSKGRQFMDLIESPEILLTPGVYDGYSARLVEKGEDADLVAGLHDASYRARPERAVVISIEGLDWNCPQHIPVRLTREEMAPHLAPLNDELARLRAENAALKAGLHTV